MGVVWWPLAVVAGQFFDPARHGSAASDSAPVIRWRSRKTTPRHSAPVAPWWRRTTRTSKPNMRCRVSIGGISSAPTRRGNCRSASAASGSRRAECCRALVGEWSHDDECLRGVGFAIHALGSWARRTAWLTGTNGSLLSRLPGACRSAWTRRRCYRFFRTHAFAVPAIGAFGTSPRNVITGPGGYVVNAQVSRDMRIGGSRSVGRHDQREQPVQHDRGGRPSTPTSTRTRSAK